MEIEIREYKEGDERGIFELFSRVYPNSGDYDSWLKKWRWQFKENPAGKSRIWLAVDGSRIAGQYPTIISKMKMHDRINLVAQNIHLMVDPDYRGKGIFQRLEKQATDELGGSGVSLVWGYPNTDSLKGHLNSGWTMIDHYSMLFRILNPFNLIASGEGHRPASSSFVEVQRFDDSCKESIDRFTESKDFTTVRDIDFLNWRYDKSNGFRIFYHIRGRSVEGYLVYKITRFKRFNVGYVFDMVYGDKAGLKGMLKGFRRQCGRDGAVAVLFPVLTSKPHRKEMQRAGLFNYPSYSPMTLYGISPEQKENIAPLEFKDMYFILGDLVYNG